MDLGLQFEEITCFEALESQAVSREETLETAIAEYCPDLGRIVDAVGRIAIRERIMAEDRYTVAGSVQVTVFYTSEEMPGVKSLQLAVPFSCRLEERGLQSCQTVCAMGRVLMLEAKAVTPRRIYVRVLPEITAIGFRQVHQQLCTGTEDNPSIRVRRDEVTLPLLTAVTEQEFVFTGEASADGPMPEELLDYRICPRVTSQQRVGSKLMVRGVVWFSALFRSGEALLNSFETELPFSQVAELEHFSEESQTVIAITVGECDVHPVRGDETGGFGVTAHLHLCIRGYEERRLSYVSDLYSTRCTARVEQQGIDFPVMEPPREMVQETVCRQDTSFAYVTEVECSRVLSTMQECQTTLRTESRLRLICRDENGTPMAAEQSQEVTLTANGSVTDASAQCGITSVQCGSDCQIRVPVCFTLENRALQTIRAVTAAEVLEDQPISCGANLILRRLHPDETLWDVAKQYHTDEEAIRQANGATDEGMLLIPRVR